MVCVQTDGKLLPETMMNRFSDIYIYICIYVYIYIHIYIYIYIYKTVLNTSLTPWIPISPVIAK